jgi:UDP-N-acetylglucosamine 4-epimerase
VIHGDGSQSRDFTYVDNVIQANELAATTKNPDALNQVYNVAYGDQSFLKELVENLRDLLSNFDSEIKNIEIKNGPERIGDIKHSLASIEKAQKLLNYKPSHNLKQGLDSAIEWYWNYFKTNT